MQPAAALRLLEELAARADAVTLRWFRARGLDVSTKPDATPVTQADLEAERVIRAAALAAHPDLGLLGEEHGAEHAARTTRLIVDPIDGTANFARGIPVYATLLAIEHAGEVIAGIASAPALGTRWSAARGLGAHRNGEPIRVSDVDRIEAAQVFHAGLAGDESVARLPGFLGLVRRARRSRGFGDFWQDVLVAEGAGEISIDLGLAPWDIAALAVIVEEAGGRATTLEGRRDIFGGSLIASNGVLHDETLAMLLRNDGRPPQGEPL